MDTRFVAAPLIRGLSVRVVTGWTFAAILLCAPFAHANPGNGVPIPKPNVPPDPGSPFYGRGYQYADMQISTLANRFGGVHNYVAQMGGPSGLCFQGAQILWTNAQPLDGDHFNPNVDVNQLYQGCLAATQAMLQSHG
jgi:hypothetical protein